jgi:hypothetical protein
MKTDRSLQLVLNMAARDRAIDDPRRPVWLEATESFCKKLNRIAKQCGLARYEALSRGLDALRRETEIRNSALNRNIRSPSQSEVFRRTMGQVSRNYWATVSPDEKRERARKSAKRAGTAIGTGNEGLPAAHRRRSRPDEAPKAVSIRTSGSGLTILAVLWYKAARRIWKERQKPFQGN